MRLQPKSLVLDSTYIEYLIYKLFYIDVVQLIKIKATLSKEFHLSPHDIDDMPYWEYEMWITEIQSQVKETNDKQEEEMKKYDKSGLAKQKQPKMPTFKMPSFGNVNVKL